METLESIEFYNRLAGAFDLMTDWSKRLAYEMPFILETLSRNQAQRVLDAACGTGWHAISLAQKGYRAAGCDLSPAMIKKARMNADQLQVDVIFEVADFAQLNIFQEDFDAILCLGNSLPHLLSQEALVDALRHMRGKLRAGGVLILHNLNYDLRLKKKPRFFSANGNPQMLVWRFVDYGPEFLTFHTALFERSPSEEAGPAAWSVQVNSTLQRPLLRQDLDRALMDAGFRSVKHFGGLDGSPYETEKSGDLIIVANM
jgi:SAM-dependent methyltransferase